jgi:transposase
MRCPYCNHSKTYLLKTNQRKCSKCERKFSPAKIILDQKIIECFCNDLSTRECSLQLKLNYITVKKRFEYIRGLIASFLEEEYQGKSSSEYDEYVYLPKTKKKVQKNIFDAHNFLTFCFDTDKVYNLLMPNLHRFKQEMLDDDLDEIYFKEFSKFMRFNKIAKIETTENTIAQFWNFFENSITRYKGVGGENFIYYLKECEFKFNYTKDERKEIIVSLFKEKNQR